MKRLLAILSAMALWVFSINHVFAFGEIFKIETSGTEYCGDFDSQKFNAGNYIDLWIRVDGPTQMTVSFTTDFQQGTTFFVIGGFYLTSQTKAAFVGGQLFVDLSFVTFQGTATFDKKTGVIKSMSGTFIQDSVFSPGCFSVGKVKTVERLFP
jgi:hypothetical protein